MEKVNAPSKQTAELIHSQFLEQKVEEAQVMQSTDVKNGDSDGETDIMDGVDDEEFKSFVKE